MPLTNIKCARRWYTVECESFTMISVDCLLVYDKKYYLQVYLENLVYKIANKQITGYLNKTLFQG